MPISYWYSFTSHLASILVLWAHYYGQVGCLNKRKAHDDVFNTLILKDCLFALNGRFRCSLWSCQWLRCLTDKKCSIWSELSESFSTIEIQNHSAVEYLHISPHLRLKIPLFFLLFLSWCNFLKSLVDYRSWHLCCSNFSYFNFKRCFLWINVCWSVKIVYLFVKIFKLM